MFNSDLLVVTNFLTTFGIAMFIALLGWGNQIKEIRKEIKEIVKNYSKKVNVKKEEIDDATDGSKNNSKFKNDGDELVSLLTTIENIAKNDKDCDKLGTLPKITKLKKKIIKLIKLKGQLYDLALEFTIVLFVLSGISYILEFLSNYFSTLKISVFLLPFIILYWLIKSFKLFIKINNLEKETENYISNHLREIE